MHVLTCQNNPRKIVMHRNLRYIIPLAAFMVGAAPADEGMPFPGPAVSASIVSESPGQWVIGNNTLTATFIRDAAGLRLTTLRSPLNGLDLSWGDPNLFTIYLTGTANPLASSAMKLAGEPGQLALAGAPGGARLSQRLAGRLLHATFTDEASGLAVQWRAIMTDGAHYLRQEITLRATRAPVGIERIEMLRAPLPDAVMTGYTDGAVLTTDKLFLGVEHPMARNTVQASGGWSPAEMRARHFDVPVTGLTRDGLRVRFDYQRGNHRIDIAKVSLLDAAGKTLAEDVHPGFSGTATSNNTYSLTAPADVTAATLRVTLGGVENDTNSWGATNITGAKVAASSMAECGLPRQCVLDKDCEWTVASGIGVYPPGQLRRAFLAYLERERAHPYRQYWHYNSWYDLNIDRNDNPDPLQRMTEAQCLAVIRAFGRELHDQRGVGLNGFVWDDGWDDWNSLWGFHQGFPNGFAGLRTEAAKQGAGMGAWLSPWGGYGGSHDQRVAFGRNHGYETNGGGFSLGGPKYYRAFRDVCLKMIRDYGQNYFKFDGIGGGAFATGAPAGSAPDLDGLVRVLGELRAAKPDLFVNCTVGTWASPYWTWFADSVWRQGGDCDYAGEGNPREQWITYRDQLVYERFAKPSPLYPLNSIMYHGLLVSDRATPARMPKPAQDIESYRHEAQMAFACGSDLGELYLTPSLMTPEAWDILAAGLKWSRAHRDILRDTHWIGGHPLTEIYGYAAWHPQLGGTLVLRNPTARELTFTLDLQKAFELLPGAPQPYRLTRAMAPQSEVKHASPSKPLPLVLPPFAVQIWEAAAP